MKKKEQYAAAPAVAPDDAAVRKEIEKLRKEMRSLKRLVLEQMRLGEEHEQRLGGYSEIIGEFTRLAMQLRKDVEGIKQRLDGKEADVHASRHVRVDSTEIERMIDKKLLVAVDTLFDRLNQAREMAPAMSSIRQRRDNGEKRPAA